MKIATWNVNSVKARLPNLLDWLGRAKPDVLLLQEIKCVDADFPALEIEALGYNLAVHGQKTYNGVAILSKLPIEDVLRGLPGGAAAYVEQFGAQSAPGDPADRQARYIEATIAGLRIASLYLPNGNPAPGEKFDYKLAWMARLNRHAKALLKAEECFVLGGDYNVCPTDEDVYDPRAFADDALCRRESRAAFRALVYLGLWDAFRARHPDAHARYSYWDYQGRAWERDNGLRIDHFLLSPQAADRLVDCDIDSGPRGRPKASDHVPVWCELREEAR